MSKRIMVTLDDDAAELLPVLAARAGKPHRSGQYLSSVLRMLAVQAEIASESHADSADSALTALQKRVRKQARDLASLTAEVAALKAEVTALKSSTQLQETNQV